MAYRREDIERVRDATDLVELVAEITKVKRSGRSVMAVCPFHQEKTPSMSVDAARGLYHCFGCGKSGDLFTWVQETQGLDFSDSLELLARRANVTLQRDPEAAKRRDRRELLVDATEKAVSFYVERLREGRDAGGARGYLRGRGYDADVVDRFRLGYSPQSGDALVGHLRAHKVPEDVMVTAGLAIRAGTGRVFDRFRGRIMFPIFDVRGDAVGFGARLLDGDGPKYLNSPETPIYRKSQLLYGLNWAKGEMVRAGNAVVVEGYTDVIALHLADMPVAVATCGTALGEEHLDLLRRFTERVVLMFDADAAGEGASIRGFDRSVPGDLDLRVASLPVGRDPADVVAAGEVELLASAVRDSTPLMQTRIEAELARFDYQHDHEAAARALRAAAAIVATHPDRTARTEYARFLANRLVTRSVDEVVELVESLHATRARSSVPGEGAPKPERELTGIEKAERELLRLLLANDPGVRDIDAAGWFGLPDHAAAFELIAPALTGLEPGEPPDLGSLLGSDESPSAATLRALALLDVPLPQADEVIRRVRVGALDREIHSLKVRLAGVDADREPEAHSTVFGELIALERRRRELWSSS
ncbi:MAG: DNA primase [Acidimicrobiia bacterium]